MHWKIAKNLLEIILFFIYVESAPGSLVWSTGVISIPCYVSFVAAVLTRMRIWTPSRRSSGRRSGGWPTTPASVCACATSTRPSRSWAACASCTWRARSRRPSCWSCTRPWQWSSAWSSKSEVSGWGLGQPCGSSGHGAVWGSWNLLSRMHELLKGGLLFCSDAEVL